MSRYLKIVLAVMFLVGMSRLSFAVGEHGGKEHGGKKQEHGGKEHGGTAAKTPSKNDIRNAMKNYVMDQSKATGTFNITDPDTGKTLNLELQRVHERVGKTGDYYYSCADFKDVNTGKMYDLDLDVANKGGNLSVVDVRVHKEEGKARYTYDDNDNRVPLMNTKSHLGKGSPKGSPKEHGGKEHGGKEHGGKEHGGKEHGGR